MSSITINAIFGEHASKNMKLLWKRQECMCCRRGFYSMFTKERCFRCLTGTH